MNRWLYPVVILGVLMIGIAVPRVLPKGHKPHNASEQRYIRNALEMRSYINHNPVAQLLSVVLMVRPQVANLRRIPGSCDGASDGGFAAYRDVTATVTDYSYFAIPIERYSVTCSGLQIVRL